MTRSLAELRQYLAGKWLFDNDFKDTSGNGNHGTPNDIEWASTQRGLKPRFNGSSSYVDCGNDASIDPSAFGEMTVSTWYKNSNRADGQSHILSKSGVFRFGFQNAESSKFGFYGNAPYSGGWLTTTVNDSSYHHVVFTYDGTNAFLYVDGVQVNTIAATGDFASNNKFVRIGLAEDGFYHWKGEDDDTRMYSTALSATEVLALYHATSDEYGVKLSEFSYQHDPAAVIPVTADTVLQIGGKLAGDAVDTISDRAGSNDATIHGAMPADGFFVGGRRFVRANANKLTTSDTLTSIDDITFIVIANIHAVPTASGLCEIGSGFFAIEASSPTQITLVTNLDNYRQLSATFQIDEINVFVGRYKQSTQQSALTVNSVTVIGDYSADIRDTIQSGTISIGTYFGDNGCDFTNVCTICAKSYISDTEILSVLNTLAVLPFWSISYTDYPDNVTTYTDRFPHSSTIISSGAFKVDDDKIQCASAGTLTYSASNEFDGAEYITVTIAGTEYSGTGTITQGNTTVSVAQGSNKITVAMGTGDTIDDILITFRKPVTV